MIRFEWRILLTDSGMGRETDKKKISLEHECRTKIYIYVYMHADCAGGTREAIDIDDSIIQNSPR